MSTHDKQGEHNRHLLASALRALHRHLIATKAEVAKHQLDDLDKAASALILAPSADLPICVCDACGNRQPAKDGVRCEVCGDQFKWSAPVAPSASARPLDQVARDEVARIFELAKRDDWHLQLVGSDIRMLCRMALQGPNPQVDRIQTRPAWTGWRSK